MIAFLKGTLEELTTDYAVVDVGGVGYQAYISLRDVEAMPRPGEKVKLYTYLNVYQDGISLYGFLSRDDLSVFRLLTTVSGVGPKAAIGVLSVLSAKDLYYAVFSDDSKTIAKAPGIGPKTAKKIILELKDKLKLEDVLEPAPDEERAENAGAGTTDASRDAVAALAALGYSSSDALRAVRAVATVDMDTAAILKAALKKLV